MAHEDAELTFRGDRPERSSARVPGSKLSTDTVRSIIGSCRGVVQEPMWEITTIGRRQNRSPGSPSVHKLPAETSSSVAQR